MIVKTITVPNRDKQGWLHGTKNILVQWVCPTCDKEMGTPKLERFHEDGEWYSVHVWSNQCGHTAKYKELKVVSEV